MNNHIFMTLQSSLLKYSSFPFSHSQIFGIIGYKKVSLEVVTNIIAQLKGFSFHNFLCKVWNFTMQLPSKHNFANNDNQIMKFHRFTSKSIWLTKKRREKKLPVIDIGTRQWRRRWSRHGDGGNRGKRRRRRKQKRKKKKIEAKMEFFIRDLQLLENARGRREVWSKSVFLIFVCFLSLISALTVKFPAFFSLPPNYSWLIWTVQILYTSPINGDQIS